MDPSTAAPVASTIVTLSPAIIAAITWVITEVLGSKIAARKDLIALIAGPATAILGGLGGILPHTGWLGWASTIVIGVVGAILAGVGNDYVAKPLANPTAKTPHAKMLTK